MDGDRGEERKGVGGGREGERNEGRKGAGIVGEKGGRGDGGIKGRGRMERMKREEMEGRRRIGNERKIKREKSVLETNTMTVFIFNFLYLTLISGNFNMYLCKYVVCKCKII